MHAGVTKTLSVNDHYTYLPKLTQGASPPFVVLVDVTSAVALLDLHRAYAMLRSAKWYSGYMPVVNVPWALRVYPRQYAVSLSYPVS
jgi:hypothetical protein